MKKFTILLIIGLCLVYANHILEMRIGTLYDVITDSVLVVMLADKFTDWILKDGRKEMSMIEALSDALTGNGVELPDTERMKIKPMIGSFRFRHNICDKDGHVEMEIFYDPDARPYKFSVHYPRFECSGARLRKATSFQGFTREQIGMVVFAYSEEEYWKFEKAFLEWSGKINERDGETV